MRIRSTADKRDRRSWQEGAYRKDWRKLGNDTADRRGTDPADSCCTDAADRRGTDPADRCCTDAADRRGTDPADRCCTDSADRRGTDPADRCCTDSADKRGSDTFDDFFYSPPGPMFFIILFLQYYSVICRPSDHTARFELGTGGLMAGPPHLLNIRN